MRKTTKKGFTLIEILIVLAIIAMVAATVIIATNPARQFAQARNTQRWSAVNSILNAVNQNMIDNQGLFDFSGCGATEISTSTAQTIKSGSGGIDLCGCLAPTYIASLPFDANGGSFTDCSGYDTGFTIIESATNGRITVAAPSAELGETISVTR
ncbi:MAG: type II secretion system protein [bacterium]